MYCSNCPSTEVISSRNALLVSARKRIPTPDIVPQQHRQTSAKQNSEFLSVSTNHDYSYDSFQYTTDRSSAIRKYSSKHRLAQNELLTVPNSALLLEHSQSPNT